MSKNRFCRHRYTNIYIVFTVIAIGKSTRSYDLQSYVILNCKRNFAETRTFRLATYGQITSEYIRITVDFYYGGVHIRKRA